MLPLNKQQHMIQLKEMQELRHVEANLLQEILWLINYCREN